MGFRLARSVLTALTILATAACGVGPMQSAQASPRPSTPSRAPTTQPGWTLIEKPAAGFSVQVPPHWDEASAATISSVLKNNPNLPAQLATQVQTALANDAIKLFVLDFEPNASDQHFVTNLNVVQQNVPPGMSLQAFADANANQLQQLSQFHPPLDQSSVVLPAGKAVKLHYQLTTPLASDVTEFILVHRSLGYILTFTTLSDRLATVQSSFQSVAETFRFSG
jgi:hypothetical protein